MIFELHIEDDKNIFRFHIQMSEHIILVKTLSIPVLWHTQVVGNKKIYLTYQQ